MKMKTTALTFPSRFWAIVQVAVLVCQFSSNAVADECKFEKKIEKTLDVSNSELLSITAAAGELDVVGVPGAYVAIIHGRLCASREAWLEQADVETTSGKQAGIGANLPNTDGNWSFGTTYLMLDMHIEVPEED